MQYDERHTVRALRPVAYVQSNLDPAYYDPRRDNGLGIWCILNSVSSGIYRKLLDEANAAADSLAYLNTSNTSVCGNFEKVDYTRVPSSFHPDVFVRSTKIHRRSVVLAELLVGMLDPHSPQPDLIRYVIGRYGK